MKATILLFSLTVVVSGQTLKPPRADQDGLHAESLIEKGVTKPGKASEQGGTPVPDDKGLEKNDKELEQSQPQTEGKQVEPSSSEYQKTADVGIQIQVEKSSTVAGTAAATGEVKVYSPWPSKPLYPAPDGWKYSPAPKLVQPYRTTVKLGSGREVDLAITPYVLTPDANGFTSLSVMEPGYQPEHGYQQQDTLGATLRRSTEDIKYNEEQAAEAITRLQQLLTTLPRAATPATGDPEPKTKKP